MNIKDAEWPLEIRTCDFCKCSRISLTPACTADNSTTDVLQNRAIIRDNVVFPDPGGPQNISDVKLPLSTNRRSGLLLVQILSWPNNSPNSVGRILSAKGLWPPVSVCS
ncbi:MAG: hypothetical protein R3B45_13360 [Bdellovibrionota bacterium]